ncbi:unnamed protein product [Lactuca virosa]|uniref:Pex N-terminal domain-containing protein n=1 Tax=Lactuca virosa TaxID=75947 RepID=A0AAU9PJE1_9ASTR|nr:unnamed protein product [Lactuca virosa]
MLRSRIVFQYEAELDAFLEFLFWRFSIWVDKPTPGNALMNLKNRDEHVMTTRGKSTRILVREPWTYSPLHSQIDVFALLVCY